MPGCPIPGCNEEFLSEDQLAKHILACHPESIAPTAGTMLEMVRVQRQVQILGVASNLTSIVFGRDGGDKEEVLRIFLWFTTQLREKV
jgi:hypothetical protein